MLGWRCLWCTTWFSTLCCALPPGPAVCAASPAAAYSWRVFCLFCRRVPDLLLLWWRRLGGNPSLKFLCFSCAVWLAGVCWVLHPVSGSSRWGCVCSLGDSVMTLLAFPYLRVGALLAWGVYGVSCCEVCSLGCPSWLVLLFMSLSFTCSWVGVVWSQVCGPTCSSCVLGSSGVSVAPFCRLSLWPHPLLMFSRLGFLPWAFVRTWVGRLRSCLGSCLLLGELPFPCPGFRLAVPAVWLSRLPVFS